MSTSVPRASLRVSIASSRLLKLYSATDLDKYAVDSISFRMIALSKYESALSTLSFS